MAFRRNERHLPLVHDRQDHAPPLRDGPSGAGGTGSGGDEHLPDQYRDPDRPLRQRGGHRVSGAGGRLPQRPPAPGKSGGVFCRPRHRREGGENEGGHLPQSPAHRAGGIRLPAGLFLHCRRDGGPGPEGAGRAHRRRGPEGGGRPRHPQPSEVHRRGAERALPQSGHSRHAPAHRRGYLSEAARPLRRHPAALCPPA